MPKSYRIRTQVGVDKSIKVQLDQDFDFLEILSIKVVQNQIYTRQCSDYGVVVGRVTANNGYGIPNAKVSIFIPLTESDSTNPIISDLYPYTTLSDLNEDGYRYNLLPYVKSYSAHNPTGTFPTREDVLTNPTLITIFDKYFKYTANTNESGDFMLFGVPVGSQTIHVDIDLSDIGEFSLSPQDLIRMGVATDAQVAGTNFRSSSNLNELPQIISINRTIEVEPLWGQPEICNLGITRTDFDLTDEANITITPTAIFMGSIVSDIDGLALKNNCKPKFRQGQLCRLATGPGEILAIRQTIQQDENGLPILEQYELEGGGQVIDENGTWLVDVPMNYDYVTTNEFGERVISNDPTVGVPTKGKYRFKIKWNQSPKLSENIKRAYYLVPNVREYGWSSGGTISNTTLVDKSYAFSLDWNEYADVQAAIDCEDTFYMMTYNKVYTVSQMIDQYRKGTLPNRIIGIKNILDDACESDNNKFPTNDSSFRMDIIFLLFGFAMFIFRPVLYAMIFILHALYIFLNLLRAIILPGLALYSLILGGIELSSITGTAPFALGLIIFAILKSLAWFGLAAALTTATVKLWQLKLKGINLPILLYDQCEFCNCSNPGDLDDGTQLGENSPNLSGLQLALLDSGPYNTDTINSDTDSIYVNQLFAGALLGNPPASDETCQTRTPALVEARDENNDLYYYFTSSLTLAERINLFNTKAKFFEDSTDNPGGGVNQIQVSFDNGANYHYDNITFMLCTPESLQNITTGLLLTFQDPTKSGDINSISGATNEFGNNAITGYSLNYNDPPTPYQITVNYSNPNNTIGTTFYTIPPPTNNVYFHKYPTDIEYFQVITAMTYSQFLSLNDISPSALPNSLDSRFLNNDMRINKISGTTNPGCSEDISDNPLTSIDNYENLTCVFMVRGVDPYSDRIPLKYDLSRIFGFDSYNNVIVSGNYKLNIPIQPGFKNVRHDLNNNYDLDSSYSNQYLYYNTYDYVPQSYSAFTSNLNTYYSSLDNNATSFQPLDCGSCSSVNDGAIFDNNYGLRVRNTNDFTKEWNILDQANGCPCDLFYFSLNTTTNRGYFISPTSFGEIIEGGTLMIMLYGNSTYHPICGAFNIVFNPNVQTTYISIQYDSNVDMVYNVGSGRQIVMRSDRLPVSTNLTNNCNLSFAWQSNIPLGIYALSDDYGIFQSPIPGGGITSYIPGPSDNDTPQNFTNQLVNSLNNCTDSVPLDCYDFQQGEFIVNSGPCETFNGKDIFNNGCYLLISTPLISLGKDIQLLTEWISRTSIVFGACRNVWSHLFTNNWINGTLYSFAFVNNRFFDANNQPYSEFCTDVIHFDNTTNNFYYRSSPYFSGTTTSFFVGQEAPSSSTNIRNLLFPTTIMDLGPRSAYLQEIVMSDEYDGYVMPDLSTTTFTDVSEILNIFIISRLANTSVIAAMVGASGSNIFTYFNRRRLTVDADYAQMISISSELGVTEFEPENYPEVVGGQDPVYFNAGDTDDGVIGIFFSSDTQIRDFITPKRTIINDVVMVTNPCAFNNFYGFSQEVPFYQWEIKEGDPDNIFGSQTNDWYTSGLTNGGKTYFSYNYQSMDRLNPNSRYFRTNSAISPYPRDSKGYIYAYSATTPNDGGYYPLPNGQSPTNNPLPKVITVGAPFHFYFGLKKGKSAFDRFARKWIKFETIE
jgi:hypothetical protein